MDTIPSDAELVARCRQRDAAAFGSLVERHQGLVFGVALARCGDPVLAEDVTQDAFVTAWRDLDRLREIDRVGSWMAGIARNLAASAARDRVRKAGTVLPTPGPVPTPEDSALEREDRELIQRGLADVPDAHREALVLYYLEGESIARIALALGISEDLVKQRLSRGRRALRETIAVQVETALGRLRPRPGLSAAVVAAVVAAGAALGTKPALAATTSGKVIAGMTIKNKLMVLAAAGVAVTGGAIGVVAYASGDKAAPEHVAAGGSSSTVASDPARQPQTNPRVRRMQNADDRPKLLEQIREAQRRRETARGSEQVAGDKPKLTAKEREYGESARPYVREAIAQIRPLLKDCYHDALGRNPTLEGDLVVEFTIEGDPDVGGLVGESRINPETSTLHDAAMRECITETMYALEVDPPAGGGKVSSIFMMKFATSPIDGNEPSPK